MPQQVLRIQLPTVAAAGDNEADFSALIAMRELPMEAFSMIGKTISHRQIIHKLGQGGTSVIYRTIRNCRGKAPGGLARRLEAKCSFVGLSLCCAEGVGYGGWDYLQNELQKQLHIFLEYPLQEGAEHAYKFLRGHGRLETLKSLLEFI